MNVVLQGLVLNGEVDAITYLKRKGEHMLAVKVAKLRNGTMDDAGKTSLVQDLHFIMDELGDKLISRLKAVENETSGIDTSLCHINDSTDGN